jgi:hypothetical protein
LIAAVLFIACADLASAQTGTTGFAPRLSAGPSPTANQVERVNQRKANQPRRFGSVNVKNSLRQIEEQNAANRRRQQEANRLQFLRDQQLQNNRVLRRQAISQRAFGEQPNQQTPGAFRNNTFFAAKPDSGAPRPNPQTSSQPQQADSKRVSVLPAPREVTITNRYSSSAFEPTGFSGADVDDAEPAKVTNPFFSKAENGKNK